MNTALTPDEDNERIRRLGNLQFDIEDLLGDIGNWVDECNDENALRNLKVTLEVLKDSNRM